MTESRPALVTPQETRRILVVALGFTALLGASPAHAQTSTTTTAPTTQAASNFAVPQPPTTTTVSTSTPGPTTTSTPGGSTTTTIPAVTVTVSHEIATGFTNANQPLGQQRTLINVVNQGTSTLFNQEMVVRMGAKPDTIYFVRDASGSVGVIDGPSGIWFHTIAQINPNSSAVFTVTWNKACPGRWPLGARVGDTLSWQVYQWISPNIGPNCPPDDTAKPEPQVLPWPASFPTPAVISPSIPSTTVAPTSGSTTSGSTTSGSTTSGSTTTTRPSVTVAPAAITVPSTFATRPPTTMLFCRTVDNKRTCSPANTRPTKTTKPKPKPRTAPRSSLRTTPTTSKLKS